MRFFLGTHQVDWLSRTDVPLFVSARRLRRRRALPRALGPWALDSGGFSELSLHGRWITSAADYAAEAARWQDEIGGLVWAAAQDWMCEPAILARTGLTVSEHQRRTIASYRDLIARRPQIPWVPVVQGYARADYLRCVDLYRAAGIDLAALPTVGVGSVCRRQATAEAGEVIRDLAGLGLRVHAFGFKVDGLKRCAQYLASADSMAWSACARREAPLPGCRHGKSGRGNCANCIRYALAWRAKVLQAASPSSPP